MLNSIYKDDEKTMSFPRGSARPTQEKSDAYQVLQEGNGPVRTQDVKPAGAGWLDLSNAFKVSEGATEKLPQWDTGANFGIRNSLENDFAVDGGRIGYEDGNVLLDGKFLMKAKNNVDGTTYTDSWEDVNKALSAYGIDNDVVAVRDYMAASGTAANIEWNGADKTVSINGQTIKPAYVIDGKAYVLKSELDAVIAGASETAGTSYKSIWDDTQSKYGGDEEAAYREYMDADSYRYNPDADPEYQAYMAVAKKAIEDEYAENMANARFRTGGVGSSGQMLQAAAIREGAVDNLAAARAQFEQQAYNRWLDNQQLLKDKYITADGRMINAYNRAAAINGQDKADFYNAQQFDQDMRMGDIDYGNAMLMSGLYGQYYPGMWALDYNNAVLNNQALGYDVKDRGLETELFGQWGPGMAQLEYDSAALAYGDAQKYSEVYREFARPVAEAEYNAMLANNMAMWSQYPGMRGYMSGSYMPYAAMYPQYPGLPAAITGEQYNTAGDTVGDSTPATAESREQVYAQLVDGGLTDEQAQIALGVMGW